jgi:polyphenol oxidase
LADSIEVIRAGVLGDTPHGFLGRRGGVSTGVVAGLNVGLGTGDEAAAVASNRRLAADAVLEAARLTTVYQVHSALCVAVTEPWPDKERPHADALVTNRPGLLLGIVTADCAPVLLADHHAGVIGAVHAGWKGAVGGVTDATIAAMEALGATRSNIAAAVGPCIAQVSYEVDAGFKARFPADAAQFFGAGKPGHFQFDLPGYVAVRLEAAGIGAVEVLAQDTYAQPDRFYSFRRATHRGEPDYGRQFSLIGLA